MSISRRGLLTGSWFRDTISKTEVRKAKQDSLGVVSWLKKEPKAIPSSQQYLVAKISPFSCLNLLGGFCATCVERCPVSGAIQMDGRVPKIDAAVCNGCMDCVDLCPAPGNPIVMVAKRT
jgi:Fe-S-cluster-containing hydrogenase component 2